MGAVTYRLECEDGTPADPPTFQTSVFSWTAGDVIPLGNGRVLEVVGTDYDQAADEGVLIVAAPPIDNGSGTSRVPLSGPGSAVS
jgi:hypothetical protein